ncbi:hypothetical protein [Vibrio parahaemolyticus]|uniref:Uncharacterized protein n=1 Tax=Vibrio parahaemolyticus TaxID=670 RepID=A0AA46L1F0_VIBPH|nr:hypothetical protein [Vibrio parahaemolyticus]EJG1640972.1 hypothetical protein [Vibrio alginolyticus]EKO3457145.1 hypothetical protein [Vibrio fluvialis]EHY0996656.1 hypothetical protein [Vibrio parahaemolyticus]EID4334203.1 hypothetical protein [Vibrio parahaemolyticus]MCR9667179.1 hypothetical protein [Vibrio parahaemolyticus]
MFKISEEVQKLKTQTLTLSGIALFISITAALPEKIAIIGLDLSGSKETAGWFLLIILGYFLIKFSVLSIFEVVKKALPRWISYKGKDLRGDVMGFSEKDIHDEYERQGQYNANEDLGTLSGEAADIDRKRKKMDRDYKSKFVAVYNLWLYISDIIFPIVFGCFCSWALYRFLEYGVVFKFT